MPDSFCQVRDNRSDVPNGLLRVLSDVNDESCKAYRRFVWQNMVTGDPVAAWLCFRAIEDGSAKLMILENSKTYSVR